MYILLLKVSNSSFSAVTPCTVDWLIDGRSLTSTKLNCLIDNVYFRVQSLTKKQNIEITVWKYTVKSTGDGTWKYTVEITVNGTWKQYGKYSIGLLIAK